MCQKSGNCEDDCFVESYNVQLLCSNCLSCESQRINTSTYKQHLNLDIKRDYRNESIQPLKSFYN